MDFVYTLRVACFLSIFSLAFLGLKFVDPMEELISKYKNYQLNNRRPRIMVNFSQPCYAPGDTAFFRVDYRYEDFTPIIGRHIVTLSLFDGIGRLMHSIKMRTDNGYGFNQMVLPGHLNPGYYRFVAYTDWVLQFPRAFLFQTRIRVLGTHDVSYANADELGIFYEGGTLVAGLPSNIIITGPANNHVVIRDGTHIIDRVRIDSSGYGQVEFTPYMNAIYKAEMGSPAVEKALRRVEEDGVSLRLLDPARAEFNVVVPPNSRYLYNDVFAIALSGSRIIHQERISFSGRQTYRLTIPGATFSQYNQLYIFNREYQILAERIFMTGHQPAVAVSMKLPEVVGQNEELPLQVHLTNQYGQPVQGNFMVSVVQDNLFHDSTTPGFSDLADLPELAEKIQSNKKLSIVELNKMLVTQKWEKADWNEILGESITREIPPDFGSLSIEGEIRSKTADTPAPDSTQVLVYFHRNAMGYETSTKNGRFRIENVRDFWDDDLLFIGVQSGNKIVDGDYSTVITRDSLSFADTWESTVLDRRSDYGTYAINRNLIEHSYSFFASNSESVDDISLAKSLEDELSGANHVVNLEEFVRFPTMKDLIREAIPLVRCRGKSEVSVQVLFRSPSGSVIFDDNPLYVIDGMITRDTDYFLGIHPSDLLVFKIVNDPDKLVRLGILGKNGVLIVESKKGDLGKKLLAEKYHLVQGLSKPVVHRYHSQKEPSIPKTRSTIYWEPVAGTNLLGEWTSVITTTADIGPMLVTIQGLSDDLKPIFYQVRFRVGFGSKN
jgi:hypothetical protein